MLHSVWTSFVRSNHEAAANAGSFVAETDHSHASFDRKFMSHRSFQTVAGLLMHVGNGTVPSKTEVA